MCVLGGIRNNKSATATRSQTQSHFAAMRSRIVRRNNLRVCTYENTVNHYFGALTRLVCKGKPDGSSHTAPFSKPRRVRIWETRKRLPGRHCPPPEDPWSSE